jgi:hypothetical protein
MSKFYSHYFVRSAHGNIRCDIRGVPREVSGEFLTASNICQVLSVDLEEHRSFWGPNNSMDTHGECDVLDVGLHVVDHDGLITYIPPDQEWRYRQHERVLNVCPMCSVKPGEIHAPDCTVTRCSVCGGAKHKCACAGHDPAFARWTGIWPGELESKFMGVREDTFYLLGYEKIFFVKPTVPVKVSNFTDTGELMM